MYNRIRVLSCCQGVWFMLVFLLPCCELSVLGMTAGCPTRFCAESDKDAAVPSASSWCLKKAVPVCLLPHDSAVQDECY